MSSITPRVHRWAEISVMALVAGWDRATIASLLGSAPETVSQQLSMARRDFGVPVPEWRRGPAVSGGVVRLGRKAQESRMTVGVATGRPAPMTGMPGPKDMVTLQPEAVVAIVGAILAGRGQGKLTIPEAMAVRAALGAGAPAVAVPGPSAAPGQ